LATASADLASGLRQLSNDIDPGQVEVLRGSEQMAVVGVDFLKAVAARARQMNGIL